MVLTNTWSENEQELKDFTPEGCGTICSSQVCGEANDNLVLLIMSTGTFGLPVQYDTMW